MRFISLFFLIVLAGAVAVFALQNNDAVSLRFFDQGISTSMALMIGAVYLLGMISGWAVIGMVRRSIARVTEYRAR
jgi:putative membrane protein